MRVHKSWTNAMMTVPFALAAACGGGEPDRSATDLAALDRELELALSGDTIPATFEDTAVAPVAEPQAPPAPPATRPAPSRPQPAPESARPAPPPPTPAPEPEPETPPAEAPEPLTVTRTVPVGTSMQLSLDEALSTRDNEIGDGFTATLVSEVRDAAGNVLIPAGATLRGRVTQVQKSGRVGETAVLSLAFEAVSFGNESYPLEASVVSANPERVTRQSTGEQVGKVAVGAAAGAILGRVLGKDTKSTVKGAVIGAAAGTAIAMGTADVDAVLKEGSLMVIRTDAPISIVVPVSG